MAEEIALYDVNSVKKRTEKLLADNHNNPDESRQVFSEFIMDWTDNYTETLLQENPESAEAKAAIDSIVKLWIEFAEMEKNLRQWKRAVKVFDDALNDSVASKSGKIYAAYANYYKDRTKLSNAQKVYLRGLTSNLHENEVDIIWKEYLDTMHKYGSPELTLEQLVSAISTQVDAKGLSPPSQALITELQKKHITVAETPVPEQKEHSPDALTATITTSASTTTASTATGSAVAATTIRSTQAGVKGISVAATIPNKGDNKDEVDSSAPMPMDVVTPTHAPSISSKQGAAEVAHVPSSVSDPLGQFAVLPKREAEQPVVKVAGSSLVPASASAPSSSSPTKRVSKDTPHVEVVMEEPVAAAVAVANEVMLVDLDDIAPLDVEALLARHHTRPPLLFCAPTVEPMVSGLDNLTDQEVQQLEKSLRSSQSLAAIKSGTAVYRAREKDEGDGLERLLDILEGLWVSQALKERHFDAWFVALIRLQKKEESDHRRSKKPTSALKALHRRAEVQNKVLTALINKVFLSLLLEQLGVLVTLDLPYFTPDTITRLHDWVAASNGIDTRTAVEGDVQQTQATLHGDNFMELHNALEEEIGRLRRVLCALLSLRLCQRETPITPAFPAANPTTSAAPDLRQNPQELSEAELYHAVLASQRERQREQQVREMRLQKQQMQQIQQEMFQRREMMLRKTRKRRRINHVSGSPRWDVDGNYFFPYEEFDAYHDPHLPPPEALGYDPVPLPYGNPQLGLPKYAHQQQDPYAHDPYLHDPFLQDPYMHAGPGGDYYEDYAAPTHRHMTLENKPMSRPAVTGRAASVAHSAAASVRPSPKAVEGVASAAAVAKKAAQVESKESAEVPTPSAQSAGASTGAGTAPVTIHQASLPLLHKLASLVKNAKKSKA